MTFVKNMTVIKVKESLDDYAFIERRYDFLRKNRDKIVYVECGSYSGPVRGDKEVTNINIASDNKTAVSIFNKKKETYKTLEGKYAVFILEGKHNLKKM